MSESDSVPIINFVWGIFAAPIGYLYTLAIGHRGKLATMRAEVDDLKEMKEKVDTLCDDVSYIKGQIDTHFKEKLD